MNLLVTPPMPPYWRERPYTELDTSGLVFSSIRIDSYPHVYAVTVTDGYTFAMPYHSRTEQR